MEGGAGGPASVGLGVGDERQRLHFLSQLWGRWGGGGGDRDREWGGARGKVSQEGRVLGRSERRPDTWCKSPPRIPQCVTLGKFPEDSVPLLPHLQHESLMGL